MSRKYWDVMTGETRKFHNYFRTRQEAVEFANDYYERKGEIVEIVERIRSCGKGEPKWHK